MGGKSDHMRPKLWADTLYVSIPEGVYLQNNRGVLTIPGKQVYHWVERLAPYLDGSHTVDELTAGLSADRRQMVAQLVEVLAEGGFSKDVTDDRSHTLSAAEARAYASEIAFIDYFCDSAPHRFQTFRQAWTVAVGSGLTLTALVQANLHVGVRNIDVVLTGECPTDRARHQEYLEVARQRDPDQVLAEQTVTGWDGDEQATRAALRPFDAVVHVSDRPMLARAQRLDRICRADATIFIQAVVVGDRAWIGPLVSPDQPAGAGWESAWRRLQANRTSPAQRRMFALVDDPAAPVSEPLTAPTKAIVANHLSFAVFKHLTGVPAAETQARMLTIDLETLQTQSHQFLPHPSVLPLDRAAQPTAEAFLQSIRKLERGAVLDEQDFSQRAPACIDEALGLLTAIDEQDLHQLPLHVSRVGVSNPALLPEPGEPITTVGVGTDLAMARRRAAQRACGLYAASIVDERRLVHTDGDGAQVWGYDLTEHRPRLVPAVAVFPTLRGLAPSPAAAPWLASGFSWVEAACKALISVCRQLTMAELDTNGAPFPRIDLQVVHLDEQGARYRRILQTAGVTVAAYQATGTLGVPSFAFCVGDHTVAYSSDIDVLHALRSGLEQTVTHEQARANQQPVYAPGKVRALPQRLRNSKLTLPQLNGTGSWADRQRWLADALQRAGRRVVAVPLDHDPGIANVLPYIVNLVVEPYGPTRSAEQRWV